MYKFYEDPGHGWLEVTKAELVRLGIADKISKYSYMNGLLAYLEEDCDFGLFYRAKKEKGEEVSFKEIHQENTFIRNLPHYKQ